MIENRRYIVPVSVSKQGDVDRAGIVWYWGCGPLVQEVYIPEFGCGSFDTPGRFAKPVSVFHSVHIPVPLFFVNNVWLYGRPGINLELHL